MPAEIDGKWNWCAFLYPTVFAGINRLWLWLLIAGAPVVLASLNVVPDEIGGRGLLTSAQLVLGIILAKQGSALAWRSRRWESIEHFKRTQRRWAWGSLVALLASGGLFAITETDGGSPIGTSDDRAGTGSASFHRAHLAEGETARLAALLLDVPGYRYVDASTPEVQDALALFDRSIIVGLSLHTVVDQQGTEVAFLQLFQFGSDVLGDLSDMDMISAMMGGSPTSQTNIVGRQVFLFENPAFPDSRFMYVWLMDGSMAAADSGDQQQILDWIRTYLSIRGPSSPAEVTETPPPGTFAENGVSFGYPRAWDVREARTPFGARWHVEWGIAVDPGGGRYRHEEVRVISFPSGAELATEIASNRLSFLAHADGAVEGPTPTSIGGLPAFEGRILDLERYGRTLELRVVMIVDGPTAYEISCQYEPEAAEIIRGCERVIDSFRVSE